MFLLTRMPNGGFRKTVIVFDQYANFQHEFDVAGCAIGSRIAVSDDSKVFVAADDCVLVYNFSGVLLNRNNEIASLNSVKDMTFIDSEGGRIVVLSGGILSQSGFDVHQFSEQGNFLSRYNVSFKGSGQIRLLHKTEHVVALDFSNENLFLYNKDGRVVREIKLKLSAFNDFDTRYKPEFTVTTQGLVVMLTTDKKTVKKMIAIL